MQRIAIVAHGLSDGGAERVASLLANYLAARGNTVCFIAAYSPDREYALRDDVEYVFIRTRWENKALRWIDRSIKIDREIRKFKADTVISFIINELIVTGLKQKVPVIHSLRNDPQHLVNNNGLNKRICFALYRRAKKIVFQTPGACDFFPENIREKGVIIANPLTENLPFWNSQDHSNSIITACRLTKQKNLPMLIRSFGQFHKQHPEYDLRIYGKGELQEELSRLVKELNLEDHVFFPGHSREIHNIMANSAMFALTSDFEGLSNSMLEALAIGVPTVCTDCPPGGAALYIEDGVSGMLVPVGDGAELTKRFCRMAEDRELCLRMSENAQKIREKLDVAAVLKQWEAAVE